MAAFACTDLPLLTGTRQVGPMLMRRCIRLMPVATGPAYVRVQPPATDPHIHAAGRCFPLHTTVCRVCSSPSALSPNPLVPLALLSPIPLCTPPPPQLPNHQPLTTQFTDRHLRFYHRKPAAKRYDRQT
jgi:hypothetical protein